MLLAVAANLDPLSQVEKAKGILDSGLATAVIAFLGAAVVFQALMNWRREAQVRLLVKETTAAIVSCSGALGALTEAIKELRATKRRAPGETTNPGFKAGGT